MGENLQLIVYEGQQRSIGPFGRSFLGSFPSKGTLVFIVLLLSINFLLANSWFSFFLFSIIYIFVVAYLSYNYIEPHFNSKIGMTNREINSIFSDSNEPLKLGDIGRLFHGYSKSKAKQLWDLSGEGSLKGIFETDNENTSMNSEFIGASDKKWVSWLIIISFLIIWFIASSLIHFCVLFALTFLIGISFGPAFSVALIISQTLMIFLILLFIKVDGSISKTKEMLEIYSVQRALIFIIAIPIIVTMLDLILTAIYAAIIAGIFGSLSLNTNLGTSWDSNVIEILLLFISIAILTPIVEELMFRGYILDSVRRMHGDWPAILWSASLFALVHVSPFIIGQVFIGGVIYGWIRIKTDSLVPTIACHSMWNIMALSLTYL
ncbi:MAG: CPBP family intramembrane metalloprotease [Euryarchaeota archaeon]|nr:CPBP family intramembrane metalloprotease [Euryarchaeota archaeon]MBT4662020.1 CPBP family intramembrane metalloprotease [Candidatus Neomarinimicrobiota bacterium]MBT4347021.1 CPBP family intramembrane metalloprotease [Euryarchaeota archaeon]MBT4961257.1 CPBP family intramembrane metalloprotease [Euryarchaeota archaeon]MBT5280620.1 CPBP family intramembrane metalloprotease [Euryarchaeota archaeon]